MAEYAYIVGANYKYAPELTALLNSLEYIGNKHDVFIIGIDLPKEMTSQFDKLSYRILHREISKEEIKEARGESEIVCRKRYWYAALAGKDYKSVCVLDADMIFSHDPTPYFDIAAKTGYILGPCKEQNKIYSLDHHKIDGEFWVSPELWNDRDLCNCPVFIDAKMHKKALQDSWDIFLNRGFKAPDMDAMNICFLKYAGRDKIIPLPGLQWLGTNEQHLKPYIRACLKPDGRIWTESGIKIISYHGHYYHDKWCEIQIANRTKCASTYMGSTEKPLAMAKGSLQLLRDNFFKMLDYCIKIEHRDYRHEEIPKGAI